MRLLTLSLAFLAGVSAQGKNCCYLRKEFERTDAREQTFMKGGCKGKEACAHDLPFRPKRVAGNFCGFGFCYTYVTYDYLKA